MALSFRLEIVIFRQLATQFSNARLAIAIFPRPTPNASVRSPARRASRKLLERIVEFVRLVGCDDKIVEYNQEQCRVRAYDGNSSLIRSFPSKVGVRTR